MVLGGGGVPIQCCYDIMSFHFLAASSWRGCRVERWWKRFRRTRVCPTASDESLYSIPGLRSGNPGGGIARLSQTGCCWCRSRRTAHEEMWREKTNIIWIIMHITFNIYPYPSLHGSPPYFQVPTLLFFMLYNTHDIIGTGHTLILYGLYNIHI